MTKLLEQAFAQVAELPEEDQDAVAGLILDELASEQRWDKAFAESQDALSVLADRALGQIHRGEVEPLDLSKL